jgi:hypothetical protein
MAVDKIKQCPLHDLNAHMIPSQHSSHGLLHLFHLYFPFAHISRGSSRCVPHAEWVDSVVDTFIFYFSIFFPPTTRLALDDSGSCS